MQIENLFENIKIDKKAEQFISLFENKNIKIEKIVSNGQISAKDFWYEQEENEFVLLLDGYAIIEFEDEQIELNKGDFINIKSYKKHRVKYTCEEKPTIWLAIYYKD